MVSPSVTRTVRPVCVAAYNVVRVTNNRARIAKRMTQPWQSGIHLSINQNGDPEAAVSLNGVATVKPPSVSPSQPTRTLWGTGQALYKENSAATATAACSAGASQCTRAMLRRLPQGIKETPPKRGEAG